MKKITLKDSVTYIPTVNLKLKVRYKSSLSIKKILKEFIKAGYLTKRNKEDISEFTLFVIV